MKFKLITVGKIKEKYLSLGIDEYKKRLTPYCKLEIIEVNETKICDNPSDSKVNSVIEDEGYKIDRYIKDNEYIIVLDVDGVIIDNHKYVEVIEKACLNGYSSFTFIIGGSYGLSNLIKNKAHLKWSFSRLVFTHQFMRLMLLEQVYRGFKISSNEPYHK